ncbi:uncharacterized protein (TIGR02677 family) [Murinocardiopsis flavida]|uniref:Uncharacterized protein (TIGR02677 family) n=1 Tax=Murinocardiopsis flavida TaxID=645275 RepID=A0A2P8DEU3_9ACTN|nr:TIGR02677 family protein [Murinocardiopsis flavida]PSK95743.1 uncharacterized protein (TIGR02677 family) [Murinocardiopsis flavida]
MSDSAASAEGPGGPGPGGSDPESPGHQPFAHLTAPNAGLYRAVMGVFARAKARFTVHLRPENVQEALPEEYAGVGLDPVVQALDRLAAWGNLRPDPDTGRVTAVEDFYRRRYIYQLTRAGEAAEEALAVYDAALGRRGALQTVALADIATQLRVLLARSEEDEPDPAAVDLALRGLVERFTGLADNARAFMGSLQRTIDLHDAEVEAFLAYKDRLIDYLERFITDLITTGGEIAGLLVGLDPGDRADRAPGAGAPGSGAPVERLLRIAAAREAADAAPDDTGAPATAAFDDALADWRARWAGLRGWFVSTPGHPAQSKLLRSSARSAIPQLLAVVATLNERRSGRSDRSADFRALARWFAEAPDDDARHRLWRTAFGLSPSRHLTIDADTLAAREAASVPPATPWVGAEPLRISPQLRRTGSYERRGKARRVTDRSEERRYLAEVARKQAEETAAARARLATDGTVRLSDLGELDPAAFGLFLQLLGDALATWRHGRTETVTTSNDGTMEIRMTMIEGGGIARITTPDGEFRGPDHTVRIVDLTTPEPQW